MPRQTRALLEPAVALGRATYFSRAPRRSLRSVSTDCLHSYVGVNHAARGPTPLAGTCVGGRERARFNQAHGRAAKTSRMRWAPAPDILGQRARRAGAEPRCLQLADERAEDPSALRCRVVAGGASRALTGVIRCRVVALQSADV
jgi:hypothetical protein